jgi:hypothetical protein
VDQAPFAVVMEAYLHGVCTRKVDDLVGALGADSGISNSEVSRIYRQPTDLAVGACIPLCQGIERRWTRGQSRIQAGVGTARVLAG